MVESDYNGKGNNKQTTINTLNRTILVLTAELQQLRLEVSNLRRDSAVGDRPSESSNQQSENSADTGRRSQPLVDRQFATDYFAINDIVEITNNRHNLRGVRGRIVNVTRTQVHLLSDQHPGIIRRKYTNVRLIKSATVRSRESVRPATNSTTSDREQ